MRKTYLPLYQLYRLKAPVEKFSIREALASNPLFIFGCVILFLRWRCGGEHMVIGPTTERAGQPKGITYGIINPVYTASWRRRLWPYRLCRTRFSHISCSAFLWHFIKFFAAENGKHLLAFIYSSSKQENYDDAITPLPFVSTQFTGERIAMKGAQIGSKWETSDWPRMEKLSFRDCLRHRVVWVRQQQNTVYIQLHKFVIRRANFGSLVLHFMKRLTYLFLPRWARTQSHFLLK